jgi:hypothetical protein
MWIRKLQEAANNMDSGDSVPIIYEDNQSAISVSKNPTHQGRTKHMRIKDLYIRERVAAKEIDVVYCSTNENVADIFTKPLGRDRFEALRGGLGIGSGQLKRHLLSQVGVLEMVTQQMERQSARESDLMIMLQCCIWCGVREEESNMDARRTCWMMVRKNPGNCCKFVMSRTYYLEGESVRTAFWHDGYFGIIESL